MAETSTDERTWSVEARAVGIGAVAGVLAGIGMGLVLQLGTELLPVFGALAGRASVLRGWLVHLVVSAAYGAFFAAILAYPPIRELVASADPTELALVGITYAVMMAAVSIAILPFVFALPWVTAASVPPFGNVPGPGLGGLVPAAMFAIAHVVYGAILGTAWAVVGGSAG